MEQPVRTDSSFVSWREAQLRHPHETSDNPPSPVRYRVDVVESGNDSGKQATRIGWFLADEPFPVQLGNFIARDGHNNVLEVVTKISVEGGQHLLKPVLTRSHKPESNDERSQRNEIVYEQASENSMEELQGKAIHSGSPNDIMSLTPPNDDTMVVQRNEQRATAGAVDATFSDVAPLMRDQETTLYIYSDQLIDFLKHLTNYYPRQNLIGNPVIIKEPFGFLLHHYEQICDAAQMTPDGRFTKDYQSKQPQEPSMDHDEKVSHLRYLVKVLQPYYEDARVSQTHTVSMLQAPQHRLWFVFKPGDGVYFKAKLKGRELWKYAIVSNVRTFKKKELAIEKWKLCCDGKRLYRSSEIGGWTWKEQIPSEDNELFDLVEEGLVPAKLWDSHDGGKRRADLIERGKRIFHCLKQGGKEMRCDGLACFKTDSRIEEEDDRGHGFRKYSGSVILDLEGFDMYSELWNPQSGLPMSTDIMPHLLLTQLDSKGGRNSVAPHPFADYDSIDIQKQSLTDDQYMLLEPLLVGYALTKMQWGIFAVEGLQDIEQNNEPLENLELDEKNMSLIRDLCVRLKADCSRWQADFVPGKGAGQVVLIHGPPGVGKTYTVECVAAYLGCPLIPITMSDVQKEATVVEAQLESIFTYAQRWKAILVIEEADVLMERRKEYGLKQNNVVSVLMHQMEYYPGLLFLTTNRPLKIDPAFASRMHMILEYLPLNEKQRKKIWVRFIEKLTRDRNGKIMIGTDAQAYIFSDEDLRSLRWNGRQIRNALQTAIALAESEAVQKDIHSLDNVVVVKENHLKRVVDMSRDFKNYLENYHKKTEEERAHKDGDRLIRRDDE